MKFTRLIALCLTGWLAGAGSVYGQSTGQISGIVKDSSGGVLPGATVTITNVNTNFGKSAVTNEHGAYVVTGLPVGTDRVIAELQGFRRAEKTGFEVTADGRITADFALAVGAMTETLQVTAIRGETVNRTSGPRSGSTPRCSQPRPTPAAGTRPLARSRGLTSIFA